MSNGTQVGAEKRFGLAPRFEVSIDRFDLGGWQQCEGLDVSFKPVSVPEMGDNTSVRILPGPVQYTPVELTRAMQKDDLGKTMTWLAAAQRDQTRYETATIILFDAWGEEVATWTLEGVIPLKWKGPSLDATKSQVALEKLTLAHEGFSQLTKDANLQKAVIREAKDGGQTLPLQFNPQSVRKSQRKAMRGHQSQNHSQGRSQAGIRNGGETNAGGIYGNGMLGPCSFNLSKVVFDSHYYNPSGNKIVIKEVIDLLFSWMEPINKEPPKTQLLYFSWGTLHTEDVLCTLVAGSVTYDRLDPDGTPSRITVNITLQEHPEEQEGTNPTSGGPGGHRTRLLVADESLAAVAFEEYGDAGVWPQLAKFNAIDDPTRLRPGTPIQVPPMGILARG